MDVITSYSIHYTKLYDSPWNGPVGIPMVAVADALSAGDRVVLKASENSPRSSELLKQLVSEYFSPEVFAVVTGGPEVATVV